MTSRTKLRDYARPKGIRSGTVSRALAQRRALRRASRMMTNMVPSYVGSLPVGGGLGSTEKKVIDINNASYALENTGTTLTLLNGCVPGSQNYNRIGRKIQPLSLQIRGFLVNTDDTIFPTKVRMIIVWDKQTNGSAPTYANIITSQNISGTTSSTYNDMINLDNRDRFRIIRDRYFDLGPVNNTATQSYAQGENPISIDEWIRLPKGIETCYNAGSAGTVGDITSGSLYIVWIASQPAATGATLQASYRLRFVDV